MLSREISERYLKKKLKQLQNIIPYFSKFNP